MTPRTTSAPTKEELLRRTRLLAQAEEQAALAAERAQLAGASTAQDLLTLPVVGAAMEAGFSSEAEACERWALEADAREDVLLARALRRVAESLREAARQSAALRLEAEGYVECADDDEEPGEEPAARPAEATIASATLRT